jgi:hypothetical protein
MTKITAAISGLLLIIFGMLGFLFPNPFGTHLTATNNFLHLSSGTLALFSGTIGSVLAARAFCTVFGAFYGILGLAGLLGTGDDRLVTLIPHQLVFGTMDHVAHLLLGGVLLMASLYGKYEELASQPEGTGFHRRSRHT